MTTPRNDDHPVTMTELLPLLTAAWQQVGNSPNATVCCRSFAGDNSFDGAGFSRGRPIVEVCQSAGLGPEITLNLP